MKVRSRYRPGAASLEWAEEKPQTSAGFRLGQTWLPVAVAALTLALLISLLSPWGNDDPYITYRYASNLLAGHGFVYNVGERILSTTAPLYALLLAALGLVWPDLPLLSNVLSAVAVVLGATFLFLWSRKRGQPAVGLLAALVLSLCPSLLTTFGAETCTYVMLILAGLYAYDRCKWNAAALALALAAMVRPDGLIAAAALALYHLVRRQPVPWRPMGLYTALVGAWYTGLWLYFGSPVPVTLLAKQQQGIMTQSTGFAAGFVKVLQRQLQLPLYWLHGPLALAGLVQVLRNARYWLPLLLWTALYFLAYTLLGVSSYVWYYAPLAPAFAVLVTEGAVWLLRSLARARAPQALRIGLAGLLLVAVLIPLLGGAIGAGWWSDPRLEVYQEIGQWLESHTPQGASVGALEVGIIGYYARRTVVDFAGLIQPNVARQMTPTSTYNDTAAWTIQTYRPDYVLLHQPAFAGLSESDWFRHAYRPLREFTNGEVLWLVMYQRSESP